MILADFFRKKPSSGNVAKDRLKLVLVSDRANCSPDIMEQIKNDIISVLQKYLEIDQDGLDIKISQTELDGDGTVPALFANIPIKDMRTETRNRIERKKSENKKQNDNIVQEDKSNTINDDKKSSNDNKSNDDMSNEEKLDDNKSNDKDSSKQSKKDDSKKKS